MENSILTTVILPASLFIIMIGMGLALTLDDFRRVVRFPKAVAVGLGNQLIFVPIIGFVVASLFPLSPELAVGVMMIAACPGGATSNLITHVAKGDIALSVTLTAVSSCVTVFTIPLIINWGLNYHLGQTQNIELPLLKTMGQVFSITALPISLGMYIHSRNRSFAQRMERPMRIASTLIFVTILLGIVVANFDVLIESFGSLGPSTFCLNMGTMGLGYLGARLLGLNLAQTLSIVIESGIQNGTLAIVIASSILFMPEMGLPAAIYTIFMFSSGGFLMWYFGRRQTEPSQESAIS